MKVGDVVEVAGRKVGDVSRQGTVVAISGAMVRIRWSSGEETSLIPAPGTLSVTGGARPSSPSPAARKAAAKKKAAPTKKKAAPKKAAGKKATGKKKAAAKKPAAKKKKAPAKKSKKR